MEIHFDKVWKLTSMKVCHTLYQTLIKYGMLLSAQDALFIKGRHLFHLNTP